MTKKHAAKTSKKVQKPKHNRRQVAAAQKTLPTDIVKLILADHVPLKKLIKKMKNSDADVEERRAAFEEFAPLLLAHAKPEEDVLYSFMKTNKDLREEAYEGDVEHTLADQMVEESKRTQDEDIFLAKVKVLAELVEHHIKEEEENLLPHVKKQSNSADRAKLGEKYAVAKLKVEAEGSDDAPREREIENQPHA